VSASASDWKALLDEWLSLDPKPAGPRQRGRPLDWRTGAVFPLVVRELRKQRPSYATLGGLSSPPRMRAFAQHHCCQYNTTVVF